MARATKATPSRAKQPKPKQRRDWRPAFLDAFERTGTVTAAARAAAVVPSTAYRERQRNEKFALDWHDREQAVVDQVEAKALELALAGSERLIEFFLKARRPELYREQRRVEHHGADGGPVRVAFDFTDPATRDLAHDLLARRAG